MLFKIFKNDWVKKTLVILLVEFILVAILAGVVIYRWWNYSKNIADEGFTLDPVFGDNMVFQQNEKIRIWGESDHEGETIYVRFDSSYGECVIKDGKWEIELAERPYRKDPLVMEIYGAGAYKVLENIKVGDLWWVIGQSNVEFTVTADPGGDEFLNSIAGDEQITICKMEMKTTTNNAVRWKNISRYNASSFSALGAYFADELNTALNGEVPIGIVSFGFSGRELSRFLPEGEEFGRSYDGPIYDNVIEKMMKFPIKGLLWYQGEADSNDYSRYSTRFAAFIEHIRKEKRMLNTMPVYVVELPPCFNDANDPDRQFIDFGIVRGEICSVATMVDDVYICPTSDLWSDRGYSNNLHPTNKKAIAKRLSLMALSNQYGYGYHELYFPPTLKNVEKITDCEMLLHFDFVAGELRCPDASEILLIDDKWNLIEGAIISSEGNKIRIKSEKPICIIRYNCQVENVFGENVHITDDALPAHAFAIKIREPESTIDKSDFISMLIYTLAGFVIILGAVIVFMKKRHKKGDK